MPIRRVDPSRVRQPLPSAETGKTESGHVTDPQPSAAPASIVARDEPRSAAPRKHHVVDRSTANWDDNGDYIVGKGRPPREHQWRKGQSGNPSGPKPRIKLTPEAALREQILNPFTMRVNGEEVTTTLGGFALTLLKSTAGKGNRQAQKDLLHLYMAELRASVASPEEGASELVAQEQEMLSAILEAAGLEAAPVKRKPRSAEDDEVRS